MSLLSRLDDRLLPAVSGMVRGLVRRRIVLVVLGMVAVVGLGAAALAGTHRHRAVPGRSSVVRVGAPQGTNIPAYTAATKAELATLSRTSKGPIYALVSMTAYARPLDTVGLTSGTVVAVAYLRVPLPGVQTEIRPVSNVSSLRPDLEAAMRSAAASEEREAEDVDTLAKKLTGGSTKEKELRASYEQSGLLLRTQAQAYRSLCACVYAVVVKATQLELTKLAARPGVRIVDPAPDISSLERVVFLPVLPEETTVVTPPPDAGLPSPSPSK